MSRAERSGSNNNGEIPLARRFKPVRGALKSKFRYLLLGSIFLTLISLFITISSNSIERFSTASRERRLNSLISADGLLLGHFPYPEASNSELVEVYPGLRLNRDTYIALRDMRAAAAYDGISLVFLSGYRSIKLQEEIFYKNKSLRNQIAIERAKVSAPPGHSEHSTGYAIDLGDATMRETDFEETFEGTPAFKWLKRNAAKFHFVLSFPKGNSQGVSYEPWHWRFEGTVDALRKFEPANKRLRLERNSKSK